MVATVNASTSAGVVITPDNSGVLAFQSSSATALTIDASQNSTFVGTASATKLIPTGSSATGNGLYLPAANSLGLSTNGTNAVYIDSSQNFYVNKTTYSDTSGNGFAVFPNSGVPQVSCVGASNSTNKNFTVYSATDSAYKFYVDYAGGGYYAGNLLVKKTSVNSTVDNNVGVQLAANGKCIIEVSGDRALILNRLNDNGIIQEFFRGAGNQVGNINAGTSTVTYNTSSDYRLKQDIAPMTGALAKVTQLKPVTYKWKVDGAEGQGFIAHELQAIVPDCITGEKDAVDKDGKPEYQGIDTSFLVATLTAAIQELKVINDSQATSIATLTSTATSQAATITALTARIVALEK
jgi:hypothetical protein